MTNVATTEQTQQRERPQHRADARDRHGFRDKVKLCLENARVRTSLNAKSFCKTQRHVPERTNELLAFPDRNRRLLKFAESETPHVRARSPSSIFNLCDAVERARLESFR
jgi:hypothetical protein